MKGFIITLALILSGCCAAQNADNLIQRFSKEKNVETVHLGSLSMSFIKPFVKELKGITSIQMLDLEECTSDVKQKFSNEVSKLKKDGYELLLKMKDDDDNVQILLKSAKDEIRELLIVTTGDDPAIVRIIGKIKQSDIQALIDKR